MFQVPLASSSSILDSKLFWEIVMLYHNRPHLVNRKLLAASQVLFYKLLCKPKGISHLSELFTNAAVLYEVRKLKSLSKEDVTEEFISNIVKCYDKNMTLFLSNEMDFMEAHDGVYISVRILLPRNTIADKNVEIVILDKDKYSAIFMVAHEPNKLHCAPPFPYELQLTSTGNMRVNIAEFEDADTVGAEWLADKLFLKLLKWSENKIEDSENAKSLSLIDVNEYCLIYHDLKRKYSHDLVKQWPTKTTTNPQKYIFEDLAIASYLICLWKKLKLNDVNFVDCGCGNGLLVYVLNQEGFNGFGIDIRRRPIWNIYPAETRLDVGTVTPDSVFPSSTWIIGNHSDELTPWIPVIGLKSSPRTNYFVLPCCPYDFNGQKYSRRNTSVSQYCDYVNYIKEISNTCGFTTDVDRLRIPSTKRICLVGIRNIDQSEMLSKIVTKIEKFIESRSGGFTPRHSIEKVRNCTQLERELIDRIVAICVRHLLSKENWIKKTNGELWNVGTTVSLSELSKCITPDDLKALKKECGGLQTLLKNHRYLFSIVGGCVTLRQSLKLTEETKKYRSKACWFFRNHPNGCLYSSEECAYLH